MHSRRRRHPCRRAVVAMLIGAAITVLIGWTAMFLPSGSHCYGPPTNRDLGRRSNSARDKTWEITDGRNAWHRTVQYWWMQISGQSYTMMNAGGEAEFDLDALPGHLRPDSVDELEVLAWYHEVGWPLPALACSVHWEKQILNANIIYRVQGGIQLPRDSDFQPRALPLVPVWPGFALDAALWACAWLALTSGARWMIRRARARRDQCVHCGYPRTGLPVDSACPECGSHS